ncbi:MAG: hypothetical protein OXF93_18615 [Acidobacteria bacterium]|nr:hypothetical protein [Acidobacteriota bacterium]
METERRKVLDMVAEGKVSADDAERLLKKLDGSGAGGAAGAAGAADGADGPQANGAPPKFLRVLVDSADGDKVNIRVPLGLLRAGVSLATLLPLAAGEKLSENGIDLSQLSGDALVEELRELTVDVDSAKGDMVRVFCE